MNEIVIYTDGSCLGNPGKGGWAAVIINDSIEEVIFGSEKESTNNRMELLAVIVGLATTSKLAEEEVALGQLEFDTTTL